MHVEVAKSRSLRAFAGEYLMIVISILTALALEQGAQAYHHHKAAREAGEKIDAELRFNIKEIDSVVFRLLNQMVGAYSTVDGNLEGLRTELLRVAGKDTPHREHDKSA